MKFTFKKLSKEAITAWIRENQIFILAFTLPFLTMMALFAAQQIYPFGNRSFLNIDMYHQYFPFLTDFFHKLKEGDSLYYSWNAGIGSNFIALYAYYLATPINWLCVLVPEAYLMEYMSYLVIVKIGLCGLTSSIYFSRRFESKKIVIAFFALFYAMSGYMAAYNWNVMWLDCIVLAPLILLGLEVLVKEGKYKLYCLSLGLAILSNYYICIMICIYLVLYFLIVLLPLAEKKIAACLRFGIFSLLSGGLGALFLIPEILALRLSRFTSADFPDTLKSYFSVFDVLARHCVDVAIETGLDHWPNIYCSVAVILLFPLYLMNKNIASKEKIGKIVLLIIMLLSFSYNIPTFIWHGFNYPDSLPARQSFLYILLVLTVCLEAFLHIRSTTKKEISISCATAVVFVLLVQKLVTDDAFSAETYLLTAIFLVIYAVLLHLFHNHEKTPLYLTCLIVLIVVVEAGSNTLLTSLSTVSRPNYLENYETFHDLSSEQMTMDEGKFYRYEKTARVTNNDSMLQDYPSVSMFSSTGNGLVNYFYNRYGMRNSKVYYCADGLTPFTSALLSCGYIFSKEEELPDDTLYSFVTEQDNVYLYKNTYTLPLGFCISPDAAMEEYLIDDKDTAFSIVAENKKDDILPIKRQNILARRLGAYGDIFTELYSEDNAGYSTIEVPYDTHVYAYCDTTKVPEITAYVGDTELKTYKKLNNKYIMNLGYHTAGTVITLKAESEKTFHLTAYGMDEDCLGDLIRRLGANTLNIEEMDSDTLQGTVTTDKDGYLVLSIPYDPGFTILVDGIKTEASLFEDMMIAIPLTSGTHSISLEYYPQGMTVGIMITLCSVAIFIAICILERNRNKLKQL